MNQSATKESPAVRVGLTTLTVVLLAVFLLMPLVVVFTEALWRGFGAMLDT